MCALSFNEDQFLLQSQTDSCDGDGLMIPTQKLCSPQLTFTPAHERIDLLGLGTYKLTDPAQIYQTVTDALQIGYRLIDTARFYRNEAVIGKALAESSLDRSEVFLTTKIWNDDQRSSSQRASIEGSLHDLQTSYLDLVLIHWPVADKIEETWDVLVQAQREGLVHHIGVSNFRVHHLQRIAEHSPYLPALNQMEHHPSMRDESTRAFCREHSIVYQAWSPFGRGSELTDPVIEEVAANHECTPAQVILSYLMRDNVCVIPKASSKKRLEENFQALGVRLTEQECARIDTLNTQTRVNPLSDPDHFTF